MTSPDRNRPTKEGADDSILWAIALAYFSISRQLQQRTGCSETRGFILSTFRGGAEPNQNQIARQLGFDRTVVHRAVRTMIREGLITESRAPGCRGLVLRLTAKGHAYRDGLVRARRELENEVRRKLGPVGRQRLALLLGKVTAPEMDW